MPMGFPLNTTIVSFRNGVAGLTPESIFDAGVSFSQLKYDIDRMSGAKPGGSVELIKPSGQYACDLINFMNQLFIYDWR